MQSETEDLVALRREIMDLLRQQMEALNSPLGLTDEKLRECYERQARVQELRQKLQDSANAMAVAMPASVAVNSLDPAA
ncbi:MAG: hypothetical protein ABR880_12685 [Candidatus Sulfotelmatobacter sp.]|jgi:hypothetical protein